MLKIILFYIVLLFIAWLLLKKHFNINNTYVIIIILLIILNNDNYEMFDTTSKSYNFFNNFDFKNKNLKDINVNTYDINDNSNLIANSKYVNNLIKSIFNGYDNKKWYGTVEILFDNDIFKICSFGINDLLSICINSNTIKKPWYNTTMDASDNLIISSASYSKNNKYNNTTHIFNKKISKYGTTDISSCGLNKTNIINNLNLETDGMSIYSLLYNLKNKTYYNIYLLLTFKNTEQIVGYYYVYFIEQLL